MLMQLPAPLDCISSTPRAPPRSAPASIATPSSSVVSATEWTSGSASERSIRTRCPASGHVGELGDVGRPQLIVEAVLPPFEVVTFIVRHVAQLPSVSERRG